MQCSPDTEMKLQNLASQNFIKYKSAKFHVQLVTSSGFSALRGENELWHNIFVTMPQCTFGCVQKK